MPYTTTDSMARIMSDVNLKSVYAVKNVQTYKIHYKITKSLLSHILNAFHVRMIDYLQIT